MKINVCEICYGDLLANKKCSKGTFLQRYLALIGYYQIFFPKIQEVRTNSRRSIDVCPDCFNKICESILKKGKEPICKI